MKSFIKSNLKIFITLLISGIVFTGIGVYAASQYFAKDINFTPTNENFKKENGEPIDNVEDAINELYKSKKELLLPTRTSSYLPNGIANTNYMLFNNNLRDTYEYFIIVKSNCNSNVSTSYTYGHSVKDDSYPILEVNKEYKTSEYKNVWTVVTSKNTSDEAYCDVPIKFYNK